MKELKQIQAFHNDVSKHWMSGLQRTMFWGLSFSRYPSNLVAIIKVEIRAILRIGLTDQRSMRATSVAMSSQPWDCHGHIESLIFILSYLSACDPGRISPYVEGGMFIF